ncbi:ABC transporter permease [Pectobacterium cacticida]|uniref:ABC transporter permease n=1 Tax=Pectobacterium cacticida TaxID=69221 RepID=UPI002FF22F4C
MSNNQNTHRPNALSVLISILIATGLWQVVYLLGIFNPIFLPSPLATFKAFLVMAESGVMLSDLSISLMRVVSGFIPGALLGLIVGLLTSRIRIANLLLNPLLSILRPIPAIALVPVAIVWFGIGEASKSFVIGYTVFLAVWLNTHHGMVLVPDVYIKASRTFGVSRLTEYLQVVVPAAAPHIMAGFRIAAAVAFLSLVAAELTGATGGIGYRLQESRQYIRVDRMFVSLIELGVLGALLDAAFVYIGRKIIHWESI